MSQETDGAANRVVKPRNIVRWTAAMRDTFLDHLAATCNVSESARVTAATFLTDAEKREMVGWGA